MTVHELMKLIDAGYTKDEISALARDEPEAAAEGTENEQSTAETAAAEPDPAAEPEQKETQAQNDPELDKRLSGIEGSISKLMKMFQQQNLRNDSMKTPDISLETETDNIMASIIRPEPTKKKG